MAINLVKGQTIDLRKNDKGESFDLSTVTIGLGWDMKKKQGGGFFGKLFGGGGQEDEYDLDAIAFLLDAQGKVANLGRTIQNQSGQKVGLFEGDVVFFNSQRHPSGHIWSTGDNRTGAGEGDDEQIIVKLDLLDQRYQRILFLVTIYEGMKKGQHFGQLENAFIRAVDARGKEIMRYNLSGDASFQGVASMAFGELYRKDGTWKFRALGETRPGDSFVDTLKTMVYS
jgi:stress response protein SCP2